jgi:hypothetical protein
MKTVGGFQQRKGLDRFSAVSVPTLASMVFRFGDGLVFAIVEDGLLRRGDGGEIGFADELLLEVDLGGLDERG